MVCNSELFQAALQMLKKGELTLGGQFTAYKRGQLERNIQPATKFNEKSFKQMKDHALLALVLTSEAPRYYSLEKAIMNIAGL